MTGSGWQLALPCPLGAPGAARDSRRAAPAPPARLAEALPDAAQLERRGGHSPVGTSRNVHSNANVSATCRASACTPRVSVA